MALKKSGIVGIDAKARQNQTVLDPACETGSLLLNAGAEAPRSGSLRPREGQFRLGIVQDEYIIVHEMAHLLERHHDERVTMLIDKFMPDWRIRRDQLNSSPFGRGTVDSWRS